MSTADLSPFYTEFSDLAVVVDNYIAIRAKDEADWPYVSEQISLDALARVYAAVARFETEQRYKSAILIRIFYGEYETYYVDGKPRQGYKFAILSRRREYPDWTPGASWAACANFTDQFGLEADDAAELQRCCAQLEMDTADISYSVSLGHRVPHAIYHRAATMRNKIHTLLDRSLGRDYCD
jgi:hypothetical protein